MFGGDREDRIEFLWDRPARDSLPVDASFKLFVDRKLLRLTAIAVMRLYADLFAGQPMERVSRFLTRFAKESIATLGPSNVFFSQGKDLSLLDLTNRDDVPPS